MQRVKWALGVIVVLVAATLAGQIGREAANSLFTGPADAGSVAVLNRVASEVNKGLPMMVDKETELTNVGALPGILVYHYRLVSVTSSEVIPEQLVDQLRPSAATRACTTPETREGLLNRGVAMRFSYSDTNGAYITAFDVTSGSCATYSN